MVRLKSLTVPESEPQFKFQFHYGSIKILIGSAEMWRTLAAFQFHYGSIKMIFAAHSLYSVGCFNSTMVRLK